MNDPEHGNDVDSDHEFVELMQRHQEAIQAGRMDEADFVTQELFAIAGRMVIANPRPEWTLEEEARNHEAAGNWEAAELAYRDALKVTEAVGEAVWQFKAHSNLSRLYRLIGNRDAALAHARLATEQAKRTELSVSVAMTLELEAAVALECNLVSNALSSVQEALRTVENDSPEDVVLYGRCLVLRAECFRRSAELDCADADLEMAMKQFKPLEAMELAAGVHGGIAEWWSVKGRLLMSLSDCDQALHAWRRAVASASHVAILPQCAGPYADNALASMIWKYGNALLAAGCAEEAEEALAESRSLRNKLGLPPLA